MPAFYQLPPDEILKMLDSTSDGVSVHKVAYNPSVYGLNKLKQEKKEPMWKKLLRQFSDPLVLVLIGAAIISFFIHIVRDTIVMITIVVVNAGIGFIHEYQAERILDSLKNFLTPKAKAIREGREIALGAEELVSGDVLRNQEGDAVPADV